MLIEGRIYRAKTVSELKSTPGVDVTVFSNDEIAAEYVVNGYEYDFISEMLDFNRIVCKDIYLKDNEVPTFHYDDYYWQEWMLVPISNSGIKLMETE